jgi:uncharacterized protein with HEPN domain
MRPEQGDPAWLWDMIKLREQVMESIGDLTFDEFVNGRDRRDSIVHRLTVPGEAANRISDALQARYAEVPWREIVDQRNVLIHAYDQINFRRIWNVTRNELPMLIEQLKRNLSELDPDYPTLTGEPIED